MISLGFTQHTSLHQNRKMLIPKKSIWGYSIFAVYEAGMHSVLIYT